MITRPTTEQLILDCCEELTHNILPALDDETLQVGLSMTITVLRNTAVRAAHEIAWMRAEIMTIAQFADAVLGTTSSAELAESRARLDQIPGDSLDLDHVIEVYQRASQTFSSAVRTALQLGDRDLIRRAQAMLHERLATERDVMSAYDIVGR